MKQFNQRNVDIELSLDDQKILVNIIREVNPKKILEVGVFRGGTSSLILDNISPTQQLFSIDICSNEHIGEVCQKKHLNATNWNLLTGNFSSFFLDEIGEGVDFLFLDTNHALPGEILDFLMVYPILGDECCVIIHDVKLPYLKPETEKNSVAPRLLHSLLTGKKREECNSGAVYIKKNEQDLVSILSSLQIPWEENSIYLNSEILNGFQGRYSESFIRKYKKIIDHQLRLLIKKND